MKLKTIGFMMIAIALMAQTAYADNSTWLHEGRIVLEEKAAGEDEGDLKKISLDKVDWNRLCDYSKGYEILYPSNMFVDVSLSEIKDVIFDADTIIEIYYDDFEGTLDTYYSYRNYSNSFKDKTDVYNTCMDEFNNINGREVHMMAWERETFRAVKDDKPYYFSAEIKKNTQEVFTIMIKSAQPIIIGESIVESLCIFEPDEGRKPYLRRYAPVNSEKSEETEAFIKNVLEGESIQWGLYHPGAPGSMISLEELEKELEYNFKGLIRYQTTSEDLPIEELVKARDNGKIVELTLQLLNPSSEGNQLFELLNGDLDEYLERYAEGLIQFDSPVLFRLNNEMNGDWCGYNGLWMGKDTDIYKKAWIYIYDFMKDRQVDNMIWVWNPNDKSYPAFGWNHCLNYFPGEDYVDVIGLTGYNTGNYYESEKWRSFKSIYEDLYDEYISYFEYPFIVSEFASNSVGGNKAEWIREMKESMGLFEKIRFYFWFSGVDLDQFGNPARTYRIDENPEIIETFKDFLKI